MRARKERNRNLVTRLTEEELAMAHRLSEDRDEPMTTMLRKLIKGAYVERFGVTPPARDAK